MFFNGTICLLLLNCKSLCNFAFERILLSSQNWVWVRKVRSESLSLSGPVGSQQGTLGYFLDLFAFDVFILSPVAMAAVEVHCCFMGKMCE